MASARSYRAFLSAVTGEFERARTAVASDLRARGLTVTIQDDFRQEDDADTTLDKLHKYVAELGDRHQGAVVCLIGRRSGDFPPDDAAQLYAHLLPEGVARASYTQWEFFFARHYKRRLLIFIAGDDFPPDKAQPGGTDDPQLQQKFQEYITNVKGLDRTHFSSIDQLRAEVLRHDWPQLQHARPVNLPYPSIGTLFKGRGKFLQQLRDSLLRAGDGRAAAVTGKAVHGLGGVGKTRLAVEYAWQHAHEFSAVLFVTADSPEALRRNLAELTGPLVLDLGEHAAAEEEVRVAAAVKWLQQHPGWFLILDNVDDELAAEAVEALLASLQGGHVLITSRLGKWSDAVEPLALDVLDPDDARQFLLEKTRPKKSGRGRTPAATDDEDASELARELDGLALEQAGAYIVQLRMTLRKYLDLWRSHVPRVQAWVDRTMKYAGPGGRPVRSVAVTWQTTLDQLDAGAVGVLNLLAWFAPDPIPLSVFSVFTAASASLRFKEEGGNAEDAEDAEEEEALREVLSRLHDFSMLRWGAAGGAVTVHRVVQEILRTRQTAEEQREWLTLALKSLDASRPADDPGDVRTWSAWEPLRPHVAFAVQAADEREIDEPTTDLMGALGMLLWAKALYAEAEHLERRALAIDTRHHGEDSPEVAVRLNNLATTLQATNRLAEAEPPMRRALAIDEQSYGAEHPDVARDLNNLAQLLQATNRLAEAEPLMRRHLEIFVKFGEATGYEHPHLQAAMQNYFLLLQAMKLPESEIAHRLERLLKEK